jgi:uncharacterized membrane protein YjgN (DUF898 family)
MEFKAFLIIVTLAFRDFSQLCQIRSSYVNANLVCGSQNFDYKYVGTNILKGPVLPPFLSFARKNNFPPETFVTNYYTGCHRLEEYAV